MRQMTQMVQQEEETEINLTPMLDVVFIMLIFFIVTASFVKEAGIDVNRPDAPTAVVQENANILVAINDRNEIWIDRRRVDPRAVRANIERLHAENPPKYKGNIDGITGATLTGRAVTQAAKRAIALHPYLMASP